MINALRRLLASLLDRANPLPFRKDGRDHIVFDQPMTRADAVSWIWEGRLDPSEDRFRPDPPGAATEPHTRFLFTVTENEFVEAAKPFKDQYFRLTPRAINLADRLPIWVPSDAREELLQMEENGEFDEVGVPRLLKFPAAPPFGELVVWIGEAEDMQGDTMVDIFQYPPEDLAYYENLVGDDHGERWHRAFTGWSRDMRYFIEERQPPLRPMAARLELRRINNFIAVNMIAAYSEVIAAGGPTAAANGIMADRQRAVDAVRDRLEASRRVMSVVARRQTPTEIIFRGTTVRWRRGRSADPHDLGPGTYFTNDNALAATYADMRGTATDPAIILRVEAAAGELGRVLDLVSGPEAVGFKEVLAQVFPPGAPRGAENYYRAFIGYLDELGYRLDDFDTIIAPEILRDGIQINVRNEEILDALLAKAEEILQ